MAFTKLVNLLDKFVVKVDDDDVEEEEVKAERWLNELLIVVFLPVLSIMYLLFS